MLAERLRGQDCFKKEKRPATPVQSFGPATADRLRFKRTEIAQVIYRNTECRRPKARSNERPPANESYLSVGENRAPLILLSDRNPLSAKLATKRVGMHWIGKAPDHVIPHSRFLPRQLIRPVRQRARAAKLMHTVDHWTHCACRNTDQDSVWKIPADPHHAACH
jgi:hypothetical protein